MTASRQQNKLIRTQKTVLETSDVGKRGFQYQPAPYNLTFTLSILSKNAIDALQIVEQILPYFQPEYTVSMRMVDSMSEVRDVPIFLNSVAMDDQYEGEFVERRVIEYTLEFTMKTYFFKSVYTGEVIKNVIERDYINDSVAKLDLHQQKLIIQDWLRKSNTTNLRLQQTTNAVVNSNTVTFPSAINSKISVGDEVFGTNLTTNPTISSIASDKLSIVLSNQVNFSANTNLKFVGSVDPSDTFVVAETVTFYMMKVVVIHLKKTPISDG